MITFRPKLKSVEEDREEAGAHIETIRICCGSILSLVQILFPLFWGMAMYANESKTKENNI